MALLAAILGSGGTAAVLLAAGVDRGWTIIEPAPLASAGTPVSSGGLTARATYARDAPGVVFVRARSAEPADSPSDVFGQAAANTTTGSGFVFDDHGRILTNAHMVAGAIDVQVVVSGARSLPAKVVGRDLDTDLVQVLDGHRIRSSEDLVHTLHGLRPGESVSLGVLRGRGATRRG